MFKQTGTLKDNWTYIITQIDKNIKIVFKLNKQKFIVKEYMEMNNFGINDYSKGYLQYLLNNKLGIKNNDSEYKPTVYH